jgi:hypothetical protein
MPVAAIGLTPIFPRIWVVPVVEIPDFDRIAKLQADPRSTGEVPITPITLGIIARVIRNINAMVKKVEKFFLAPLLIVFWCIVAHLMPAISYLSGYYNFCSKNCNSKYFGEIGCIA